MYASQAGRVNYFKSGKILFFQLKSYEVKIKVGIIAAVNK